jgi:zinc protease
VYVVHAQDLPGKDEKIPGTFFAYAGCDPDKVNEVVDVMLENIARLQGPPQAVNVDWFNRSKALVTTSEAMNRETPAEQARTAAMDEVDGVGFDWHDKLGERIQSVTLDQVRGVAAKKLKSCVVTVTTPSPELVQVKTGVRTYKEFPPVDLTPRGVQHDAK